MKKLFSVLVLLALATTAMAQQAPDVKGENPNAKKFYMRGYARPGGGGTSNLTYHTNGVVIRNAHVIYIFWGPSFDVNGADHAYATELQNFRNGFGTTPEYNTITQYYGQDPNSGYGNIAQSNLAGGTADWVDTTTPPTNVTDALVQSEVKKYLTTHTTDYAAIYEVVLPAASFSSDGTSGSCGATGGIKLAYCAYHSHYVDGSGQNVKYSIQPYASCSGCSVAGFTAAQNQEHFITHETREAVTDALGNAWYDRSGSEADDKCAWTPTPFIGTGGFGYQYEWSNANSGCIKTK